VIIQLFSDLHTDVSPPPPIAVLDGVDVVVVAGDTCQGAHKAFVTLRTIIPEAIPIVMVMGNHEYYRRTMPDELALARELAPSFNIHLLENGITVIHGVRFVGCSLWTDYRIFGPANAAAAMNAARASLNDHRVINWRKDPWSRFRPEEALLTHVASRAFLVDTLTAPFAGPTVVVTHHAPHWNSVQTNHPYQSDLLTAAFVSDLSGVLVHGPNLWLHGHVHHSNDYRVGRTRVISNSRGYSDENPSFNPALVVEVSA
jgi:Icc-related predicted phosphoesterase